MEIGSLIRGDRILKRLSSITSEKRVFLVQRESTAELFVLKILKNGTISEEIKIGKELGSKCPYLVGVFEVLNDVGSDKDTHVLMEYCDGGTLMERINKNSPPVDEEIYTFIYEAASAIEMLHKDGIIHRDVNPENFFLIKAGGFRLAGYGGARVVDFAPMLTMTSAGTPGYTSPEILGGERVYSNKVDIYSFGVTLLHFITGKHPFSYDNGTFNINRAVSGKPIDAVLKHPHPCVQMALRMVAVDPACRPTASEILSGVFGLPLLAPYHTLCRENARLRALLEAAEGSGTVVRHVQTHAQSQGVVPKKTNAKAALDTVKASATTAPSAPSSSSAQPRANAPHQVPAVPYTHEDNPAFRANPKGGFTITRAPTGFSSVTFTTEKYEDRTVLLSALVTQGVWRWTVEITYGTVGSSQLFIGAAAADVLNTCDTSYLGSPKGTWSFAPWRFGTGDLGSKLFGVKNDNSIPTSETCVPNGSLVTVEVNTEARTLSFFVGERKVPRAVSNVHTRLHLGISGRNKPSFTNVSFRRLPAATQSPVQCTFYEPS